MSQLNPQQLEAVNHFEGPLLVLAGAGSGKTRVVTQRIYHLLELGVPASEILAVTFTNKAAEEMRHRTYGLCKKNVLTCTFHSLGVRILRESIDALGYSKNFHIYDSDDSIALIKSILKSMNEKDEKGLAKALKHAISNAKNDLIMPHQVTVDFSETRADELLPEVYMHYQQKLKEYNALDFDDLLFLPVKLFQEHPEILEQYQKRWSFLLIDEYQDTNRAQYILSKSLTEKHKNIFAVGDPDQSIYSWRGAHVGNILNFEKDFPGAKVIALDQNYRSTNTILQAANALIQNNPRTHEKHLWSELGEGEKIGYYRAPSDRREAEFVIDKILSHNIPLNQCVIFYRTNFQSRLFEDQLLRDNIPYTIIGGVSFYQRREIKDLFAYLRMILSDSDFIAFARTINLPKRGIGPTTLTKLKVASEESITPILSFCQNSHIKLSAKQQAGLYEYTTLIQSLRSLLKEGVPLSTLIRETIERSGYLKVLKADPETYEDREANLNELISKAAEWQEERDNGSLTLFLEELTLKTSDEIETHDEALRLMTIHNSKGLEFPVVCMVGMEEDLFPHVNVKNEPEALEEERRLCYVGMTRAKKHLYMTASEYRYLWGSSKPMRPSRFLKEIPEEYLTLYHEVDQDFDSDPNAFNIGDRVFHKDFGNGHVTGVHESSLGLCYKVQFPDQDDEMTLVAKYARLAKV